MYVVARRRLCRFPHKRPSALDLRAKGKARDTKNRHFNTDIQFVQYDFEARRHLSQVGHLHQVDLRGPALVRHALPQHRELCPAQPLVAPPDKLHRRLCCRRRRPGLPTTEEILLIVVVIVVRQDVVVVASAAAAVGVALNAINVVIALSNQPVVSSHASIGIIVIDVVAVVAAGWCFCPAELMLPVAVPYCAPRRRGGGGGSSTHFRLSKLLLFVSLKQDRESNPYYITSMCVRVISKHVITP